MTSPASRECVEEAPLESGVSPWMYTGETGGMVMKRRQPGARRGKICRFACV